MPPMYNYECEAHGPFEKIKKISERQSAGCPQCNNACNQRLSTPAMLQGGYMDKKMSVTKGKARGF